MPGYKIVFFYLQVQDIVDDYKNANLTISKNCKKISEMLLVKIDGKRVYDNLEFEEEQVMHWWTSLDIYLNYSHNCCFKNFLAGC